MVIIKFHFVDFNLVIDYFLVHLLGGNTGDYQWETSIYFWILVLSNFCKYIQKIKEFYKIIIVPINLTSSIYFLCDDSKHNANQIVFFWSSEEIEISYYNYQEWQEKIEDVMATSLYNSM